MDFDAKKTMVVSLFLISVGVHMLVAGEDAADFDLSPDPHAALVVRVKTLAEVAGSLRVGATQGQMQSIPMKVNAEVFYDEKGLPGTDQPCLRHYWKTAAHISVNDRDDDRQLRADRSLVLLTGLAPRDRLTSPQGPLTRDELELLDLPGGGFPPESLLPTKPVKVGDTWSHERDVIAQLLRLSSVTGGNLESKLMSVEDDTAKIELEGRVEGTAAGIATEVAIVGSYQFDLKHRLVRWLALSLQEKREVSMATPGFEVVSRVRTARKRVEASEVLTAELMHRVNLEPTRGDRLLDFISPDKLYEMAFDRNWYPLKQRDSSLVMRMVDEGQLIATCKVDRLNRVAPGTATTTLLEFQKDVQRALDRYCEGIVAASESINPQGIRVLRVEAKGTAAETPVHWVYCHLSNEQGYQLSTIFSFAASERERFNGVDESLTSSLRFLEPEEQAELPATASRR